MPDRIQLRRTKGWRMPPNTVKVDRTTMWGNPFTPKTCGTALAGLTMLGAAAVCVRSYRKLLVGRKVPCMPEVRERVMANIGDLRGKNLACWCKPGAPCHADVLLELANRDPTS